MEIRKIPDEGLIVGEKCIVRKKGPYFQTPSQFAKSHMFCILWASEYICVPPYRVLRHYLNFFILFHILEGELLFEYRGQNFTARSGDIVLLDCHVRNHYWTEKRVKFQYFHFSGNISQEFCDMLYEQHGALFSGASDASLLCNYLMKELSGGRPNDHKLSSMIYNLLSTLASHEARISSPPIADAQQYILNHFHEPLNVEDIARHAALSKFHFSRLFREETGFSPHEYLFNVRMHHARELLSNTGETVDSIAAQCGFSNTSNFIRAFKKDVEVTPAMFRKFFDPAGFKM